MNEFLIIQLLEVWDTLEVAHIGITKVKALKVYVFVSPYKMFKMKEKESIKNLI